MKRRFIVHEDRHYTLEVEAGDAEEATRIAAEADAVWAFEDTAERYAEAVE